MLRCATAQKASRAIHSPFVRLCLRPSRPGSRRKPTRASRHRADQTPSALRGVTMTMDTLWQSASVFRASPRETPSLAVDQSALPTPTAARDRHVEHNRSASTLVLVCAAPTPCARCSTTTRCAVARRATKAMLTDTAHQSQVRTV